MSRICKTRLDHGGWNRYNRHMKIHSLCLMGLLLSGVAAADEQKSATTPEVDVMTMVQDARCKQVVVTCLVNNQPMRMLLDTGASHTVLHTESAARLEGVQWLDTSKLKFNGNSQQRPEMLVSPLLAGPASSPQHLFMVLDLSAVRSSMAEKVDGILGMDVLGSVPFTFDLRKGEFYWGLPTEGEPVPMFGAQDKFGRLWVDARCGGKTIRLLLDTGSSVTRVAAQDWSAGSAGAVAAHVGDVDTAASLQVTLGNPADMEVGNGVFLRGVSPMFGVDDAPPVLGMDALSGAALVHLPTKNSPFGAFFLMK